MEDGCALLAKIVQNFFLSTILKFNGVEMKTKGYLPRFGVYGRRVACVLFLKYVRGRPDGWFLGIWAPKVKFIGTGFHPLTDQIPQLILNNGSKTPVQVARFRCKG